MGWTRLRRRVRHADCIDIQRSRFGHLHCQNGVTTHRAVSEPLLFSSSIRQLPSDFKRPDDTTLTANRQTSLLAHQLLRTRPRPLLRPISLAYSSRSGNVYLRRT